MGKLGYTWYPKDWGNSDKVFELNLAERGLYRELIDIAMMTDNKGEVKTSFWARKFNSNNEQIGEILLSLIEKELVIVKDGIFFISSCEPRLNLSRGGSKGGSKSKPTPKPTSKPTPKPTPNQKKRKEKKVKEIEENIYREFKHLSLSVEEFKSINEKYTKDQIDDVLDSIENFSKNDKYTSLNLTARKWLKKEHPSQEPLETKEQALERKRKEADRF